MTKKLGQPTENPTPYKITVRIDEPYKDMIESYCKQEGASQMECIRRGMKKLKPEIKKITIAPRPKFAIVISI